MKPKVKNLELNQMIVKYIQFYQYSVIIEKNNKNIDYLSKARQAVYFSTLLSLSKYSLFTCQRNF